MKFLAVVLLALVTVGCSGGGVPASTPTIAIIPAAHAEEITPPQVLIADKPCPGGSACIEFEDPSYFLQFRLGPVAGKGNIITYRLPYDFKMKRLDGWVGTGKGSWMETGGWFQYQKPDGHKAQFLLELDKHTDTIGEKQREWMFPAAITLPAGTLITVYNGLPITDQYPGCIADGSCAVDVRFMMYSE